MNPDILNNIYIYIKSIKNLGTTELLPFLKKNQVWSKEEDLRKIYFDINKLLPSRGLANLTVGVITQKGKLKHLLVNHPFAVEYVVRDKEKTIVQLYSRRGIVNCNIANLGKTVFILKLHSPGISS